MKWRDLTRQDEPGKRYKHMVHRMVGYKLFMDKCWMPDVLFYRTLTTGPRFETNELRGGVRIILYQRKPLTTNDSKPLLPRYRREWK